MAAASCEEGATASDERRPTAPIAIAPLPTITARRDFLAAARARKWVAPGVMLQGRDRADGAPPRVGFTCSKKIGNAVTRNRAKRRLRAAARAVLPAAAKAGWDYVLIGRPGATVARPFAHLVDDLQRAVAKVHRPPVHRPPARRP